eukprot:1793207-Rhodomonas_salina.1
MPPNPPPFPPLPLPLSPNLLLQVLYVATAIIRHHRSAVLQTGGEYTEIHSLFQVLPTLRSREQYLLFQAPIARSMQASSKSPLNEA